MLIRLIKYGSGAENLMLVAHVANDLQHTGAT